MACTPCNTTASATAVRGRSTSSLTGECSGMPSAPVTPCLMPSYDIVPWICFPARHGYYGTMSLYRLQARMREHGLYIKQRALAQLRSLLLAQPLSQDTLEVHHRLLLLLLCLARQPLKHAYEAPAALLPPASPADAPHGLQTPFAYL